MEEPAGTALRATLSTVRTRPQSALAAILMLVAVLGMQLTASASPAAAEGPNTRLQGHIPATGGFGLLLWTGGSTSALLGEAERKGCSVLGIHVNRPDGRSGLVTYIPDTQIAAANQPFFDAFPDGRLESMPVMLVCRPRIQGVVLDAEGEPSGDVRVTAWPALPLGTQPFQTRTASDGSFDLVVDRGGYFLTAVVVAADESGVGSTEWYAEDGFAADRGDASEVTVPQSGVTGLTFQLQPTFVISGVVLNSDGSPHPGLRVQAVRQSGWGITGGRHLTDPDGRFVLRVPGEDPATVQLTRRASTVPTWYQFGWYGPGGYATRLSEARYIVPGTPESQDIEIVLPTFRTISGTVRGPDGAPVDDIQVQVVRDDVFHFGVTRDGGAFDFSIPEGRVRLLLITTMASSNGQTSVVLGWDGVGGVTPFASRASYIDLRDRDVEVDVRIPGIHWITGHVRQPGRMSPLPVSLSWRAYNNGRAEGVSGKRAADDGAFGVAILEGFDYTFRIKVFRDGRWVLVASHDAASGVTYGCERATPFRTNSDLTDVEITLSDEILNGPACP